MSEESMRPLSYDEAVAAGLIADHGLGDHAARSDRPAGDDDFADRADPATNAVWDVAREELSPGGARLSYQLASDVKVTPPTWLWPRWLVGAAVQLLVGRQGSGKSTFAAWVIAQLSTGRRWPAEAEDRLAVPCGMLSLEEPAERLVARLIAAGADLDSVHILGQVEDHDDEGRPYQRPWRLPGDCGALEATIFRLGLAAVSASDLRSFAGGRQCELIANCRSRQPAELRELSFRELVTQCE